MTTPTQPAEGLPEPEITQADRELLASVFPDDAVRADWAMKPEFDGYAVAQRDALRAIAAARRQGQGGGKVEAPGLRDAIDNIANNLGEALEGCRDYDTAVAAITPYIDELFSLAAVKVSAPPSAPVGVEARARELFAEWHRARGCGEQVIADCLSGTIQMPTIALDLVRMALAQQPAAPRSQP